MANKLSEISKPVAWTDTEELRDLSKHRCAYMFIIDPENQYHDPRRQLKLYSQEYVSVLEKRIAELEAKLAIPVRLPKTNGYWTEKEKAFEEGITLAKREVRLAGFRCEEY